MGLIDYFSHFLNAIAFVFKISFALLFLVLLDMLCYYVNSFSIENNAALSEEGKVLNHLLKTSSVPAREKIQMSKVSPGSCECKIF